MLFPCLSKYLEQCCCSSGRYNNYYKLGYVNHLFLTVLDARKSKIKVLVDCVLVRVLFLLYSCQSSHFIVTVENRLKRASSFVSSYKGINPIHDLIIPQRPYLLLLILGVSIPTYESRGHTEPITNALYIVGSQWMYLGYELGYFWSSSPTTFSSQKKWH